MGGMQDMQHELLKNTVNPHNVKGEPFVSVSVLGRLLELLKYILENVI
jgi:hypothetical protein